MKGKKNHTPEQIVKKLTEADQWLAEGCDSQEVARRLGVAVATYYRWRNKFGGLKADYWLSFKRSTRPSNWNPLLELLLEH